MSHSNELKYLTNIALEVEDKLCWGNPVDWKNSNFIDLSNEIKRSSNVRISADTLKRVFGKVKTAEQYSPQLATKDALAVFLGYTSWSHYKYENPLPSNELVVIENKPVHIIPIQQRKFTVVKIIIPIVLVLLVFVFWPESKHKDPHVFSIKGKYLTGNAYHTAIFDYDISQIRTDSVFLDFGDETPRQRLDKKKNTISHYYRGPGYYHVNMMIDKESVYDTAVYLTTDGWEAYTFFWRDGHTEYLPVYDFQDSTSGVMSIEDNMPGNKGIDTTKMYWVQYANFQRSEIDGDNFQLVSELLNDHEIISARCNHVKINIIGEYGEIRLYFLREGCSKWVDLQFSEVSLNGADQDLSAFGKDFLDFQKVTINNQNRNVSVFYEDSLLLEQKYQKSLGRIKGIAYIFSGVGGAVKSSELEGL
ncbi:hypothetical protein [Reichenbachiella sp. MALMAid0571]|uniref:hypothetical protein n=1 Tax=Reichenbachiella sp. MALMAid0571 TaxID=3143939 RepID=UPI0032DEE93D